MNKIVTKALGDLWTKSYVAPVDYICTLLPVIPDQCYRLYICHRRGQQLTPNYTRQQQDWLVEPYYLDRNWCWRPYFFSKVAEVERISWGVFSEPYEDLESHQTISTFIYPLRDSLFLFIDCCDLYRNL